MLNENNNDPSASGFKDVEGNVAGHPMNRQDIRVSDMGQKVYHCLKHRKLWKYFISFSVFYGIAGHLMGEPFRDTLKIILAVGFFIWWGIITKQIDDDKRRD